MPKTKRFQATLYNPEWLRRVYVDESRNAAQVADLVGCTNSAVLDALRRHGIAVKGPSYALARTALGLFSTCWGVTAGTAVGLRVGR